MLNVGVVVGRYGLHGLPGWRLLQRADCIISGPLSGSSAKRDGSNAGSKYQPGTGCQVVTTYVQIRTAQHVRAIVPLVVLGGELTTHSRKWLTQTAYETNNTQPYS